MRPSHARESKNLIVAQSTRLGISTVPIWCWRPRELTESCCSLACVGSPKKLVLRPAKEYLSNKMDELATERKGKQTRIKVSSCHSHVLYLDCHCLKGVGWGSIPVSNNITQKNPPVTALVGSPNPEGWSLKMR